MRLRQVEPMGSPNRPGLRGAPEAGVPDRTPRPPCPAGSRLLGALCGVLLLAACAPAGEPAPGRLLRSYARLPLLYDLQGLGENHRAALEKLWPAAEPMGEIFWKQMLSDAGRIRAQLEESSRQEDKERLAYFLINYGPYDRIRNYRNFLSGGERPPGAAFYPEGLASIEFEDFLIRHPVLKPELESPTTLVRRQGGGFDAIAYEKAYAQELSRSASFLDQAAQLSASPAFARYLRARARALLQGGYGDSDRLWVALRGEPLDLVIGPIETSEDHLLGIKAAYEAALLVWDPAASRDLARFARWADQVLPPKGFHRVEGPAEHLEVWQVALFAGQLDAGVKTIAMTLPNDEEIRTEVGTRKLIFSNVLRAKFEQVLLPLSRKLLSPEDAAQVTEEALLQQALLHESCHAFQGGDHLGPLADTLPVLDELKADLLALEVASEAAQRGWMSADRWRRFQISYLAGVLRAVRLGMGTVHAQANAVQLDALLAGQALLPERNFLRLQIGNLLPSVRPLLEAVLQIERHADYAAASRLLQEKSRVPASLQRRLIALDSVPIDVAFDYQKPPAERGQGGDTVGPRAISIQHHDNLTEQENTTASKIVPASEREL